MMQNDLISRSELKSFLCKCCNILHLEDPCEPGECNVMGWVSELPAVDAVPVEKLGKFGKLFLPYKGCPRGRVGRMGDGHLEEEALFWGTIEDVDGGRWVPVVEAVLLELIEKAKSAVDAVEVVRCKDCNNNPIVAATENGGMAMAKEICSDCEKVFEAGPYSFLCPECRKRRLSEAAKKRRLNKLGNDAYSQQQAERKAKMEW